MFKLIMLSSSSEIPIACSSKARFKRINIKARRVQTELVEQTFRIFNNLIDSQYFCSGAKCIAQSIEFVKVNATMMQTIAKSLHFSKVCKKLLSTRKNLLLIKPLVKSMFKALIIKKSPKFCRTKI